MKIFRIKKRQRATSVKKGMILLFTLIVMITVTSVVCAYLGFVSHATISTSAQISVSQAIYLADAGIHYGIYNLKQDSEWTGTTSDVSLGEGTISVSVTPLGGDDYQLTSTGTVDNSSRQVQQSFTVSSASWTEIIYDEFESGFGNWTDGGDDCIYYTHPQGTHAHQGNASVNLQDDTDYSVVTTSDLTLSAYSQVKVDFWYEAVGLDSGEDFWLQISTNGGSDYTTVQSWAQGTDFANDTFYEESVTITGYSLTDQTRIRFRCDASNNGDDVYLDEIRISASSGGGGGEVTVENVADTWQEL